MNCQRVRILIADSDEKAKDVLRANLADAQFELTFFDEAELLFKHIQKNAEEIDIIIMDMQIPGDMSGMECLRRIKNTRKFRHIPFIMQTNSHDVESASQALSSGAYYFLEKGSDKAILNAVITSAMDHKEVYHEIENTKKALMDGLTFMEEAKFRIKTLDDMNAMTSLLCNFFPDPDRVNLGIHELLTNAIEHGNLQIDYALKSELIMDNKWHCEVEKRLNDPKNNGKFVEIHLIKRHDRIEMTITDQGEGFICDDYLDIDPARLFDPHGRGIAMAKRMSFDELEYIGCGNQVKTVIFLK